jgi:hypothetical protein
MIKDVVVHNGLLGSPPGPSSVLSATGKELVEENQIHLDGLALRAEGTHRNTQESIVLEEPYTPGRGSAQRDRHYFNPHDRTRGSAPQFMPELWLESLSD